VSNQILRTPAAFTKLGLKRSSFYNDYVYRPGVGEHVPGTTIKRLRPVQLGPRARGYLAAEIDALIEELRAARDGGVS